ncbi:LysR substrate-binding domain-containing protein [Nitrincola sp.]|uniref:LysR substrate-binding domain-containing protein n=1 Tax=Nitrincola sp. TaxID=1926584 RepID=UPI003A8F4182
MLHPDIALHIEIHSSPMVVDLLQEHRVDLGFVQTNLVPQFITPERHLHIQIPCVCICHRNHPFSDLSDIGIEDMDGETFIELNPSSHISKKFNNLCNAKRVNPKRRIQASLSQVVCNLVARGHGISIVDQINATQNKQPNLCYLPLRTPMFYEFHLMYPPVSAPSPLVNQFVDQFINLLPEGALIEKCGG